MLDIVNGILLKIFSFIIFKVDCFIGEEMIQNPLDAIRVEL
jgi:hypothetical protein